MVHYYTLALIGLDNTFFVAKVKIMIRTMRLSQEKEYDRVIFEGDAINVILALKGNDEVLGWRGIETI